MGHIRRGKGDLHYLRPLSDPELVSLSPSTSMPPRAAAYPELRYMGSKTRLLPWIHGVLNELRFDTAADPFSGSGCVAYLLKTMGKRVHASDVLNFPIILAAAAIANSSKTLSRKDVDLLISPPGSASRSFIEDTFSGIFFTPTELRFLDRVSTNLARLNSPAKVALARAALIRSCLKKQPRGVFTISGDLSHYDDGRRDLRLPMEDHFLEQVAVVNKAVFSNGLRHSAKRADVFSLEAQDVDLVYLDPPYVPRADDNCYVKRYHFLEGLSCYWEGMPVLKDTKTRKIAKVRTPFGYRKSAIDAFDRMFSIYRNSIIVLSYSSNGYPDLDELMDLMRRYKKNVLVHEKEHRYHFGTHAGVERSSVEEYLIVGR